jgi:hypothetical protein
MISEKLVVARSLALIPCIVGALWTLAIVLCREWVKQDLRERICQPIAVRWRPLVSTHLSCAFRVKYIDFRGQIHRAACRTYWHWKDVRWTDDEIIGETHENLA